VLLCSLGSVLCEFSVAYLVYRALGLTSEGYLALFSMQTFLYLAVSFAPTPGGAGATEGGFYLFFAMVFPQNVLFSAMLVWRLFTYYSQLILGAGFVVADELRSIRRQRRQSSNLKTSAGMVDIKLSPDTGEIASSQDAAQADGEITAIKDGMHTSSGVQVGNTTSVKGKEAIVMPQSESNAPDPTLVVGRLATTDTAKGSCVTGCENVATIQQDESQQE